MDHFINLLILGNVALPFVYYVGKTMGEKAGRAEVRAAWREWIDSREMLAREFEQIAKLPD